MSSERQLTPEELNLLAEDMKNFRLCGGQVIDYAEWDELPPQVKAAMIKGSRMFWAEIASMIGAAAQGLQGELRVMSEVDGGDRLVHHNLVAIAQRYMARRMKRA